MSFAIWHFFNINSPSFDSIRYFQYCMQFLSLPDQNSFYYLSTEVMYKAPLWIFLLFISTLWMNPPSLSALLFVNNLISFSVLFSSFIWLLDFFRFDIIKKAVALILLLLSCTLMDMGKVLMPEILSLAFLNIFILTLFHYRDTQKNHFLLYSLLAGLCTGLSNFSNLYYLAGFYFLFLILFPGKMIKSIPVYLFIASLLWFKSDSLKLILSASLTHPDISGSWNTASGLPASIFWQIFGFINTTSGVIWFLLALTSLSGFIKNNKNSNSLVYCLFFIALLSGLAWIKPLTGHDFISTGYRYQLPLIPFFCILSASGFTVPVSSSKKIFFFLLLIPLIGECFLRNTPFLDEYNLKLRIPLSENSQNQLQWNGTIDLFKGGNTVISGGALSRFSTQKSAQQQTADDIYKKLSSLKKRDRWIQFIVPDAALYFAFVKNSIENNTSWTLLGDYKNPVIPLSLQQKLRFFKNHIPSYRYSKPDFIFLSETDYLVIDLSSRHTEPELQSMHNQYLAEFQRIKNQFILIAHLSPSLKLYKNIHTYGRNLQLPLSPKHTQTKWALYESALIKEDSYKKNYFFFKSILKKEKITFTSYNEKNMKTLLNSGEISTIILPYGPYFPKSCLSSIIYFIEKGGNVWFTGGKPFSKLLPEQQPLLSSYIQKKIGIYPYSSISNHSPNIFPIKPTSEDYSFLFHGSKQELYKPTHGNFFPYRCPCAQWTTFSSPSGVNHGFFYQFYRNPYGEKNFSRILLWNAPSWEKGFSDENEKYLFTIKTLKNFINPLQFVNFKPKSLFISPDNQNSLILTLSNSGYETIKPLIHFRFTDNIHPPFQWSLPLCLQGLSEKSFEIPIPKSLPKSSLIHFTSWTDDSFIHLKTSLLNPSFLKKHPSAVKDSSHFKTDFIQGVNYYPSKDYDSFWLSPNLHAINDDFKNIAKKNLRLVRMHYIHSDWYKDINREIFGNRLPLRPSYSAWETLHAVFCLAEIHHLTLCLDLFSLVGSEMGNPEGWTRDPARFSDQDKILKQNIFLIRFLKETAPYKNFHIDLINEPQIHESEKNTFIQWVKEKTGIIKSLRPDIPVTVGFHYPGIPIHDLDYYSLHDSKLSQPPYSDKPVILQEYWLSAPALPISQEPVSSYSELCQKAKELGYNGFMPWIFRTPEILDPTGSPEEEWETSLGFFENPDGSDKLIS